MPARCPYGQLVLYLLSYMRILTVILLLSASLCVNAREWKASWEASARMGGTTGTYMPFWSRTGGDGILPVRSAALLTAGCDFAYDHGDGWSFGAGLNLAGAVSPRSPLNRTVAYALVDRLYLSGSWKMVHLDLGMRPRSQELGDLSITGGNVIYSGNARNIPGVNLRTDWIFFEKGHRVGIKANFAHYHMIDRRYVRGTMVHNKALALKVTPCRTVDMTIGIEHWAQWGGNSPEFGPQPSSMADYLRILVASKGDRTATESSRVNVLGNHLGREYLKVDWRSRAFVMTFQYDKPFEDGSGLKFRNFPDGVWSLKFSMNDRNAAVTDIVYEFVNTTWQSGPEHDREATPEEMELQNPESPWYGRVVLGGQDDYFANTEYRSGWTNYGRVIGLPLILPSLPSEGGAVETMASTRLRAHHLGIGGNICEGYPYRFKATYSCNYGCYDQPEESVFSAEPWQLSLAFEVGFKRRNLPVLISAGLYGDIGRLYQNSVGLTLKISYRDFRLF